jgi:hypothetical protein
LYKQPCKTYRIEQVSSFEVLKVGQEKRREKKIFKINLSLKPGRMEKKNDRCDLQRVVPTKATTGYR